MSKDNIKTTYIDGDLSIGEDLHIGGNATQHGDSHIKGNVKIEGWLDAPNVKSAYKGFFICEADLEEAYPTPQAGWWAVVGNTIPGPIYISVNGCWKYSMAVGGLTGEEIHIAKELGQNDYAISQKAVTDALADKLNVINAESYFEGILDFIDNTVVSCNADGIPYGPKIAYEFPNATPKPLLAFYDSGDVTDDTIVYKGFMTDPLRCIIITLHKGEGKATFKVINIPDESDLDQKEMSLSGGILNVKRILSARPSDWNFSETFVQESRDGDVVYIFNPNSNTGAFWYRFLDEAGKTCCCKKWYNSYLYNDESTGYAQKNNLFYHEDENKYFTIGEDAFPVDFLDYKFDKSNIATSLGYYDNKVVSQKTVTEALADKADKKDLDDKLSVVELSGYDLEFIKDSESNDIYKATSNNLSEILNENNCKNIVFYMPCVRLIDATKSNTIILETGNESFCFLFARHQQGKYYYNTTATNLKFYKEGASNVFKKYNSALVTLVLDTNGNNIELHFDNANNFEKLEIEKDNYKIVLDQYGIYSQHGGDNKHITPQIHLEPQRLSVGGTTSGNGAVLEGYQEANGYNIETVYLYRYAHDVRKEGIKLSDGKVKFFHDIEDHEELPIIVTGIADPNNDNDAVNKKYVDTYGLPVKVTHAELVELVNRSALIEGQEYEITDYEATAESGARVFGHNGYVFNIIVKALDQSNISYDARCSFSDRNNRLKNLLHNGNINAWQIKYQLKPDDTYIFDWTDPNGKGTIFWMKDDVGNEAPFDFYNLKYKSGIFNVGGYENDPKLSDIVNSENYAIAEAVNSKRMFNNNNRIIYEYSKSSNNVLCRAMISAGISDGDVCDNTIVITSSLGSLKSYPIAIIADSGGIAKHNHIQDSVRSIVIGSNNIIKNSTLSIFRGNNNYVTNSSSELPMPSSFIEYCNIINGTLATKSQSAILASRCNIVNGTLTTRYNTVLKLTLCSVKSSSYCTEDSLNVTLTRCDLISAQISSATPSDVLNKILYNDAIISYDEIFSNNETSNDNIKTYTYRDKIFLDESPNSASAGQRITPVIFSNNPLTQTPQYGDIFRIITDVKDDRNYPEGANWVSGILIYHNETNTFYPFIGGLPEIKRRGTILDVIITQDGKAKVIYNSHTYPEIGTPLPTKLSELENDTNFAEGMSIITINEWVNGDNLSNEDDYIMVASFENQRVIISKPLDTPTIFITPPIELSEFKTFTSEFIFSTGDSVPEIGFYFDYKWSKEPIFNPNKTYAISIEGNNVRGSSREYLAMYAEFDLNTEE